MATYTDPNTFKRDVFPVGPDEIPQRIIDRAAEYAYNRINSRLMNVYAVPFTTVPPEIVTISDMLTKCFALALQAKRAPILPKPGKANRASESECEQAAVWMDELVAGRSGLTGVSATDLAVHTRASHTPIFDLDDSVNHHPDPDLLDQIDQERD